MTVRDGLDAPGAPVVALALRVTHRQAQFAAAFDDLNTTIVAKHV